MIHSKQHERQETVFCSGGWNGHVEQNVVLTTRVKIWCEMCLVHISGPKMILTDMCELVCSNFFPNAYSKH